MSAKKSSPKTDREKLFAAYMTYVLENEKFPVNVYKFCKENEMEETEFYNHFGSLDGLKKGIWNAFFEQTIGLIEKDKQYESYGNREKMLSFYFTFFELLNLNRSYILFSLNQGEGPLKQMGQLTGLRARLMDFAKDLIEEANAHKSLKITKHNPRVFAEGAWVQLVFLLRFWLQDDSAGFEKTDMAIEKSVNTIFDVFDNTPLDRVVDFGKFLYKEHLNFN